MTRNEPIPRRSGEELFESARKLCEKEGGEGWKLAQKTMLQEKACNQGLQEAIEYAMLEYKPDYFRPALLSFCCKAVGGNVTDTVPIGAALTLFAWAIGIHDDIIDQSKTKNGRPTIPGKFGKDLALILSDVLLFKGFTLLRKTLKSKVPVDKVVKILETVEEIWFEQSEGEALEIQHRGATDVTPDECLRKIRMRASEIEACTRVGGILGGGTSAQIDQLGEYGRLVGMMGILRNEVIDMLEMDVLKHRIRTESLPLPVVYALQNPATKRKLSPLITKSRLAKEDLKDISELSDAAKGIENVASLIHKMSKEARSYAKSLKSAELNLVAAPFLMSPKEWRTLLSD